MDFYTYPTQKMLIFLCNYNNQSAYQCLSPRKSGKYKETARFLSLTLSFFARKKYFVCQISTGFALSSKKHKTQITTLGTKKGS